MLISEFSPNTVEGVFNRISKEIKGRRVQAIMEANSSLLDLYRDLGNYLAHHSDAEIEEAATYLKALYGEPFEEKQLRLMIRLARIMPQDRESAMYFSRLSWRHIVCLLDVEDSDARLFYSWLAAVKGDSEETLAMQIENDVYSKARKLKGEKLHDYIGCHDSKLRTLTSKGMRLASRKLFDYDNIDTRQNLLKDPIYLSLLSVNIPVNQSAPPLVNDLHRKISNFITQHHYRANSMLVHLFWTIGQEIKNANIPALEGDLSAILAPLLSDKFGKAFDQTNYQAILELSRQFPKYHQAAQLASLVNWRHVLVLLPLANRKEQLFYAKLVVAEGLSPEALKVRISENPFGQSPETGGLTVASVISTVTRERNNIVTITEIRLSAGSNVFNRTTTNVFEDEYYTSLFVE